LAIIPMVQVWTVDGNLHCGTEHWNPEYKISKGAVPSDYGAHPSSALCPHDSIHALSGYSISQYAHWDFQVCTVSAMHITHLLIGINLFSFCLVAGTSRKSILV
jgi:hypothetical protein